MTHDQIKEEKRGPKEEKRGPKEEKRGSKQGGREDKLLDLKLAPTLAPNLEANVGN